MLAETKNGPVIDNFALIIAPDAIADPAGFELRHIARDHAIEEGLRVSTADAVFAHRRQIHDRAGIADGEILEFDILEISRRQMPLPAVPAAVPRQLCQTRIEGRRQRMLVEMLLVILRAHHLSPARIAWAAL